MTIKIRYTLLLTALITFSLILTFHKKKDNKNEFNVYKIAKNYDLVTDKEEILVKKINQKLPSLFFFGFTYCPDICPNTLYTITTINETIKKKVANYYFVTVDPDRDNIKIMNEYLKNFSSDIVGVTGSAIQIRKFLDDMYIYYKKIYLKDTEEYTMDHSSQIFLFKKNGDFYGTVSPEENVATIVKKILFLYNE